MLELLISNAEALGGSALTAAVGALLLRQIQQLKAENTAQHEQGRVERVETEVRLTRGINQVEVKVDDLSAEVRKNGKSLAYVRGSLGMDESA